MPIDKAIKVFVEKKFYNIQLDALEKYQNFNWTTKVKLQK